MHGDLPEGGEREDRAPGLIPGTSNALEPPPTTTPSVPGGTEDWEVALLLSQPFGPRKGESGE